MFHGLYEIMKLALCVPVALNQFLRSGLPVVGLSTDQYALSKLEIENILNEHVLNNIMSTLHVVGLLFLYGNN
jgi:hypothetical protein